MSNHFADPRANVWGYLTEGMGVFLPPFFVLSGLMLYRPFARRTVTAEGATPRVASFYWRRFVRIVPAFWALVLASILLLDYDKIDGVWFFLRPLLMVHFFTRAEWITGIEPTWTVPTEMLFYLALPVIAWVIHKFAVRGATPARRARRMFVPLVALVLIGMAWTAYCFLPSMTADVWYLSFWPFGYVGYFMRRHGPGRDALVRRGGTAPAGAVPLGRQVADGLLAGRAGRLPRERAASVR